MPHGPCWPHHHISLVGQICLIGFSGLISHNGLIGFIGLGIVSLVGFISLFGYIGLAGCIGHNGLVSITGLSLFILVGLSTYWLFKLKTHGVAIKLTSTTKITNAAILYYCTASWYNPHLFVRESWLLHVLYRLNSFFFGDAIQNAKQIFSIRLSKMTKYCIMREFKNILCGYLYDGDLEFVILKGISIIKFPKRFLEIFSRDLTSFLLQLI
jgi:hypothetical protein